MNTPALTTAADTSEEPTFGEETAEFMPWLFGAVFVVPFTLLAAVLWAPSLLLLVMVATPFLALGLLGAAAAIIAAPILLAREAYERLAERRSARRSRLTRAAPALTGGPR